MSGEAVGSLVMYFWVINMSPVKELAKERC